MSGKTAWYRCPVLFYIKLHIQVYPGSKFFEASEIKLGSWERNRKLYVVVYSKM